MFGSIMPNAVSGSLLGCMDVCMDGCVCDHGTCV
jgi:hypothetical protein